MYYYTYNQTFRKLQPTTHNLQYDFDIKLINKLNTDQNRRTQLNKNQKTTKYFIEFDFFFLLIMLNNNNQFNRKSQH